MADISKIKLPDNVTYNIKDANAIPKNTSGNTQMLRRPASLQGANDVTLDSKINTLRANRLAFLPADQIIIEKTVDGGTTWTDAGVSDVVKVQLFSEVRPAISIPLLNGKKSPLCGLRITITAMKYNVPDGTAETQKYNYWNSNYIKSTERYNQLKEMYFWVTVSGGYINVKAERAKGNDANNWSAIFNDTSFNMTGYSGNDYISFSQGVFGGGTTQTSNFWNYRITFMTDDAIPASPYDGYSQSIYEIRGYGDTWWTAGNEYAANDKIYTHDYLKNVTFPANVTATRFIGPADSIRDAGNGNSITAQYSGSGLSSAMWIAAWNGYKIAPINQANITAGKATADASGNTITSYYAPKSTAVTNVALATNKITKTINGTTTDVVTAATTSAYGITKLNSATNSTSTTEAATPSSVKTAYDLANTANGTANTALSGVNGSLIYDHTYTISNGVATFTPHVYQKGVEVTTNYAASCFVWKFRLIDGSETTLTTKSDRGCDVTISQHGYGGHVVGTFTPV